MFLPRASKADSYQIMRFASTVFLVPWMSVAWAVVGVGAPLVVEIWPGTAPDESGNIGEDRFLMSPKLDRKQAEVTESPQMISDVTKPSLTNYPPTKDKNTATAMLIC